MPLIDDINAALSELEHMANTRADERLIAIHARLDNFRHALFGGSPPAALPQTDPNERAVPDGDIDGVDRGSSAESNTPLDTTGLTPPGTEREVASENDVRETPSTPAQQAEQTQAQEDQGANAGPVPNTPENQGQDAGIQGNADTNPDVNERQSDTQQANAVQNTNPVPFPPSIETAPQNENQGQGNQ